MNTDKLDVLLPAGGCVPADFGDSGGVTAKALLPLGEKTVLERTLDVLRSTGRTARCVVIGTPEVMEHPAAGAADVVLPEAEPSTAPSNILRGLEWLGENDGSKLADRVLVVTTDLPFLTPYSICRLIDSCPCDVDICVPLVTREVFDARFPGIRTDYVRLRDGDWTMASAFVLNPRALSDNRTYIERVFAARKSQFGMVRILGPGFIVRFLTGRLTIADIEARAMRMLHCTGRGIRDTAPELAFDIDSREEYDYALEHK